MRAWLLRRIHPSRHVTAASLGVIVGVAVVPVAPGLLTGWFWVVWGAALIASACIIKARWLLGICLIAGMLIGFVVGSARQAQLLRFESYHGRVVRITGIVSGDVAVQPDGSQRLYLRDVSVEGAEREGRVWLSTDTSVHLLRGDRITVMGAVTEGFGNTSGVLFRAQVTRAERPVPGDIARQARDWFNEGVRTAMSEPEASLGVSYVTGHSKALPESLEEDLRVLGLIHLAVASGYHLTIGVRFTRKGLARLSKLAAFVGGASFIWGVLLLTGFSTTMTRAAIVAGLSLAAWYYGRVVHPLVLLTIGAALSLLIDPSFLWGDLGWHLSFAAFAGVLVLAPLINSYFWGDREPGALRYIFVATLGAQVMTFPLIALTFEQYSPLALLANLLVQPLVPLAMLFTVVAGFAGVLVPFAAGLLGWPAYAMLWLTTKTTDFLSTSSLAYGEIAFGAQMLVASYLLIVALVLFLWRSTNYNFRKSSLVE